MRRLKQDNPEFPTVFEDLGPRPVMVQNKTHLQNLCKSRGLTSVHLENSMGNISRNPTARRFVWNKYLQRVEERK